jgi:hypothetical protein
MPKQKSERVIDRKQQLIEKITECETVVRGVENSEAWKIILKDIDSLRAKIDDNWAMQFDSKKLDEMRVTKFAVMYLLNIINSYKSDLEIAKKEMYAIDNPNTVLNKYYDSESPNYE